VERANKQSELGERRTTAMVDRVKWKVVLAVGAVAGGTLWYVRRKSRRAASDAELWAEATDPITRFGDA
jgi:hypothetical protein